MKSRSQDFFPSERFSKEKHGAGHAWSFQNRWRTSGATIGLPHVWCVDANMAAPFRGPWLSMAFAFPGAALTPSVSLQVGA